MGGCPIHDEKYLLSMELQIGQFRVLLQDSDSDVWGAFRGIGVKYSVVDGVLPVSLDEMTLRESEVFKEL
jgi:hypothetical protein